MLCLRRCGAFIKRTHVKLSCGTQGDVRALLHGSYPSCVARHVSTAAAAAAGGNAVSGAGDDRPACSPSSAAAGASEIPKKFIYAPRLRYTAPWRSKSITDFLVCQNGVALSIAHTYHNPYTDITVTLIPLRHFAHPEFFKQVDDLCCQHESVLVEGRTPLSGAPYSTMVPPRERLKCTRPVEHEDDEGWEPREVESFFQPFSWGVMDSPSHTVLHAADKYDYEKLPWWCSVRFNTPVLGSLAREQHCLNMIYPLRENMYKSFAIPWGAAHMPVFHEMLLDNGFETVGMCSLLMLNRVDGMISEGEFSKMERWQRQRACRVWYLYGLGLVLLWWLAYAHLTVEYRSGPREM
ncbi:conserved hypothetical protein [Leishmania braziliensis MHOM/BR/75/M2904]|uniref:Uncharacterized protein n=2 Tax=Leishmania braziliensis TaxID=5660 RepID=A4H9Q0_LEIBR|nr:conserved hypothetical protein [Leishmania braziliensis MHOM/BR/75/M2904]CAJ2470488.1 unnamed protein product [Leishmania braziliensis]CAM38124.1 conserved hypothetical protein [Leishmania braziliensis MHOM/BR/75/M2904]SYZ64785.1 hypothetical_protein [Leishmania braziliensis MHOM/BR/75/M2904]